MRQVHNRDGITLFQGPFQTSVFRPGQFDVLVLDPPSNITDPGLAVRHAELPAVYRSAPLRRREQRPALRPLFEWPVGKNSLRDVIFDAGTSSNLRASGASASATSKLGTGA